MSVTCCQLDSGINNRDIWLWCGEWP